jgi:hypothetical protein
MLIGRIFDEWKSLGFWSPGWQKATDLISQTKVKTVVGPAGLEPKASWFVAVNGFVDPAQLTNQKGFETASTWTQSWTPS